MNPISIFIVEDELLISASLKSQLQSFGYEVLGSSTKGEQCVEEIERLSKEGKEPEIVLMDIHLRGEIDGIETARRLVDKFNCAIIFWCPLCTPSKVPMVSTAFLNGGIFFTSSKIFIIIYYS